MGWVGSLRKESWNGKLLRAASELAPKDIEIKVFDLAPIPMFNADIEGDPPAAVQALWADLGLASGLLVASPEYNYGVPALVKNAIDWASRPPQNSPLSGKPVALMGASVSTLGTVRAQIQLRQSFASTNSPVLQPEVLVGRAHEKFDAEGRLADATTRKIVARLLGAFELWMRRFSAP
jgi:chromate reductase